MIVDENNKPPVGIMGGSVHDYERSVDPFHRDAVKDFPQEIQDAFPKGERKTGWTALDAYGNAIGFIEDGAEFPNK